MAAQLFSCLTLLVPISISSIDAYDYMCPGVIDSPEYYRKVHIEPTLFGRRGQGYEKMRFRIFYDKSMDKLPAVFKSLTNEVADFWSNALSVKPYDGTVFIKRNCGKSGTVFSYSNESKKFEEHCSERCAKKTTCADTVIPEDHLKECTYCVKNGTECHTTGERGKGIQNADMVFYVSGLQAKRCKANTIAYTKACNLDPEFDRPIVGGINICPLAALPQLKRKGLVVSSLKHEMMHALGFNPTLYNLFRDSTGQPLVERNEYGKPVLMWKKEEFGPMILKTIERQWHVRGGIVSSNRTFIVTPNVVREVKAHFNCTELEGAELEDFGGKRTAVAHWETRVYYNDLMKGSTGPGEQRMSRIDFALLEDTGWYKVNYSLAEPMKYGKDLGCDFCMNSCKYFMDKKRSEGKSVEPFCDQTEERSSNYWCNKTDRLYSGCPLKRDEETVSEEHQYFDKLEGVDDEDLQFYSGVDSLADLCPIPLKSYIVSCNKPTSEDALSLNLNPLSNIPLQANENDSHCFESRTNWTIKEYKDTCSQVKTYGRGQNAGCYKFLCMAGLLVIQVSNKHFPCFFEGQVLEISLFGPIGNTTHEGTIVCPSCVDMCGQSSNFKCKPYSPTLAFEYPYVKNECIDGDSLEKKIASLNKQGNNWITSNDKTQTDCPPNKSSTLVPIQLTRNLVTFVVIKIFI